MRHLPTELIDYIIDFHYAERKTLIVCSLVCRDWVPASRYHLFRAVLVHYANVHPFVELLASPLPNVASYVNMLRIHHYNSVDLRIFDTIAPYLKDFVAIRSLSMVGRQWFQIREECLSQEFGRVDNMELTGITYDFSGRFNFEFTLGGGSPFTFPSRLRFLGSTFDGGGGARSWLPVVAQLPAVGELDITDIQECHLPTIQAMLRSGGQSIHTIKLDFFGMQSGIPLISDCVDLTHNTNLRSLLMSNVPLRESEEIPGHRSFAKIFERISSDCVTHIRLDISVKDFVNLTRLGCREVAEELNRPRFSKLQEVFVFIYGAYDKRADAKNWVLEEMSCLKNCGVLTVHHF